MLVGVAVQVGMGVLVGVGVGVLVGVAVGIGVGVGVDVHVGVLVAVGVGVDVGVDVLVAVGVGVGVCAALKVTVTVFCTVPPVPLVVAVTCATPGTDEVRWAMAKPPLVADRAEMVPTSVSNATRTPSRTGAPLLSLTVAVTVTT